MPALPPVVYVGMVSASIALAGLLYAMWRNRVVLVISQSGSNITNRIFTTDDGLAVAYMMEVKIINDSTKPVTLRGFDLKLLWRDLDFRFLDDPVEVFGKQGPYKIPGSTLQFPYDAVINHRVFTHGVMQPGEVVEGLLLARGLTQVPFPHGSEIELTLSVYDQRGKPHNALFIFTVWSFRPESLARTER